MGNRSFSNVIQAENVVLCNPSPELFNACINSNLEILEELLKNMRLRVLLNEPYSLTDKDRNTELYLIQIALIKNNFEMAKILTGAGADISKINNPLPLIVKDIKIDKNILINKLYRNGFLNREITYTRPSKSLTVHPTFYIIMESP